MAIALSERLHKKSRSCIWLLCALAGYSGSEVNAAQAEGESVMPGRTTVEIARIDGEATGYATFQSHNQKIVANRNGIFTAHIRSRNEEYTAQEWRLSRSVDGGETFAVVYEATHATNPPVLETDREGNIYLMRVDFVDGNAYLYRFAAADDYAEPVVTTVPGGAAGKYSMFLDQGRKQLYFFSHNNNFFCFI